MQGSSQKALSGRDDDASPTLLRTLVDGFLDGLLVLGSQRRSLVAPQVVVCRLGAILGYHVVFLSKLRHADALLNLSVFLLVPALSLCAQDSQHTQQQCLK